jgi:hypothetical protein
MNDCIELNILTKGPYATTISNGLKWSSLVSMKYDYLKAKNVGFCFAKF